MDTRDTCHPHHDPLLHRVCTRWFRTLLVDNICCKSAQHSRGYHLKQRNNGLTLMKAFKVYRNIRHRNWEPPPAAVDVDAPASIMNIANMITLKCHILSWTFRSAIKATSNAQTSPECVQGIRQKQNTLNTLFTRVRILFWVTRRIMYSQTQFPGEQSQHLLQPLQQCEMKQQKMAAKTMMVNA